MDLRQVPLFESLSDQGLARLEACLRRCEYPAGRIILSAGDPPSEMHLIVDGAVRVELDSDRSSRSRATLLGPGQVFGEMAVVSGSPVSATIVAHRDTVTLSLSAADLSGLLEQEPGLYRHISDVVIDRLRHRTRSGRAAMEPAVAVIVVDGSSDGLRACASSIAEGVRHYAPDSLVVDALPGGGSAVRPEVPVLGHRIDQWRTDAAGSQYLLCMIDATTILPIASALRPGDAVLFLTENAGHAIRPAIVDHAVNLQTVLVDARLPSASNCRWVCHAGSVEAQAPGRAAGHWDRTLSPVMDRLARWLTHREVGIALSVGAAAGFVQLGLLAALEDAGIPLDFVCGASVGGVIAAWCAQTANVREAADAMIRYGSELAARRRVQWIPRSGLVNETWLDQLANSAFSGRTFADLRYPAAVVAADLVASERVVFDTGALAPAIRATSAIPGIFPPVRMGSRILVDGGLVTRVPADLLMQRRCGLKIASVVRPDRELTPTRLAEQADALHRELQAPFGLKAALGASWRMLGWWDSAAQARRADVVIDMPVPSRDGFNFGGAQRLVDLGRRIADARIDAIRESFERMLRPGTP